MDEEERDWHGMSTSSPAGGTERATTPSVPGTISESGSHSPRTLCALCTRMTSNKQTVTKRKNSDDFKTHRISKIVHVDVLFVVCFLASHRVVSFGAHKQSRVVEFKRGRCEGHRRHQRSRTVFFCVAMFSEINKAVSSSTKPPLISNKTPETNVHQKHCHPFYRC